MKYGNLSPTIFVMTRYAIRSPKSWKKATSSPQFSLWGLVWMSVVCTAQEFCNLCTPCRSLIHKLDTHMSTQVKQSLLKTQHHWHTLEHIWTGVFVFQCNRIDRGCFKVKIFFGSVVDLSLKCVAVTRPGYYYCDLGQKTHGHRLRLSPRSCIVCGFWF